MPKDRSHHGIQGLIPGNQDEIAEQLGEGMSEDFFNSTDFDDVSIKLTQAVLFAAGSFRCQSFQILA